MELRQFMFKNPSYKYNEKFLYAVANHFDRQTEEYKNLSDFEKEQYINGKALELYKISMINIIYSKVLEESKNTHYLMDKRYLMSSVKIAIEHFPLELYPNIVEWVNDEEISYIDYHGLSMRELLGYVDFPEEDKWPFEKSLYKPNKARCFVEAMILISEYVENGCEEPMDYLIQAGFIYRKPDACCH